ncbi:helix-turn-helix domain-containing protein [Lacrimispora sp. JR3]|uniref:helix-turn-helix domain-containing protein n=1 Tax=Lacrimispora sinapis TaxID=3111456 RepID=UPI00374A43B9
MNTDHRLRFGKYVETLRKSKGKSLRETAKAIKVSPQFYSEVEKGRSSTFTAERLKLLAYFLMLDDEQTHTLYDMAAESRSSNDITTPQDCADYMLCNSYVIEALRLSMETGAGEKEWQVLLNELKARRG